jgi:hypothetical protein
MTASLPHTPDHDAPPGLDALDAPSPRATMTVLPRALQIPLTALTGRPAPGQRAWRLTPTHHLAGAALSTVLGTLCSACAVRGGAWVLALLPGWMLTVHGLRNLRQLVFHQCGHFNLYGTARVDAAIGRVISTLLMVEGFPRYRQEHIADHHSAHHMTLHDPTVKALLITVGLRPGMTRSAQWRQLVSLLLSPAFHVRFIVARVRSHFASAAAGQRVASTVFLVGLGTLVTLTHAWLAFLVAWVVPVTIFYQSASILRLAVKHVFPAPGGPRRGKEHFASLTYGVFLGEPVPAADPRRLRRVVAWARWTARMLLVHFPFRYMVLTGDTVCHDYHHRHPRSADWANYLFVRERDLCVGHPGWPPYREVWGFAAAVNLVFDSLTRADPAEFDVAQLLPSTGRRRAISLPGDGTQYTPARLIFAGIDD